MSHSESDYDKQFEEELEKARALSLETYALEKYKYEQERRSIERYYSDPLQLELKTQSTANLPLNEEPLTIKSRPRPGGGGVRKNSSILLPPATNSRKNSSVSQLGDLISFGNNTCTDSTSTLHNEIGSGDWFSSRNDKSDFNVIEKAFQPISGETNVSPASTDISNKSVVPFPPEYGFKVSYLQSNLNAGNFENNFTKETVPYRNPTLGFKTEYLPNQQPLLQSNMMAIGFNQPTLDVLKLVEKKSNNNLIDLTPGLSGAQRGNLSVLEAFDPLATKKVEMIYKPTIEPAKPAEDDNDSVCSGSIYDPYNPFDYMYSPNSIDGSQGDPVYAAVVKERNEKPPPLPPRNPHFTPLVHENLDTSSSCLYESIKVVKRKAALHDPDLQGFYEMVKKLRRDFMYDNMCTNVGLVTSPTIDSSYVDGTSIKLIVYSKSELPPIPFTCDVTSTVEHVIMNVVCALNEDLSAAVTDYVLKVWGLSEYLTSHTMLSDYEYIHECIKLEKDVRLSILHMSDLIKPLARTARDDATDEGLKLEDLLPNEPVPPISYDTLIILLGTLEKEFKKVETAVKELSTQQNPQVMTTLQPKSVIQAVKAVCAVMGQVETLAISEAIKDFSSKCHGFIPNWRTETKSEVLEDIGNYSIIEFKQTLRCNLEETIIICCNRIREAVRALIQTYCLAFRVDFQLENRTETASVMKPVNEIQDTVMVYVGALHRLLPSWAHDKYIIASTIYHGTRPVGQPYLSPEIVPSVSFFKRVVFHQWMDIGDVSVSMLPRESRLVLVVYGLTLLPSDHELSKENPNIPQYSKTELGWSAIQLFNSDGILTQGSFLLSLWPANADKRLSPAPVAGSHPYGASYPVIQIELPEYGGRVIFPKVSTKKVKQPIYDFTALDNNTQQLLIEITKQDIFSRPEVENREILWEKRHYLVNIQQALPKVLLAAHSWDYDSLSGLHALVDSWCPMEPLSALQLLLPCFPDKKVREKAISWVKQLGNDELVDYLPQLVQALKHETYEDSQLAQFLLDRSLTSPRFSHYLYWLLLQTLPGQCPQNTSEITIPSDENSLVDTRYHRRLQLMLRALLSISGDAMRQRFMSQQYLVMRLYDVAENVKQTKQDTQRLKALQGGLEIVHNLLEDNVTCLPLSPSLCVAGVQIKTCSYFPSNTLPLKIHFLSDEGDVIPAIFKAGDDLRQDMLTLQMIRIMNKLWLKQGLDLKMVTFKCIPTGTKRGMIELVTDSETLGKIHVEHGVTGSFKDKTIANWLAKHNPSAYDYERAVRNFTASCAGYSVATYILGICDRHNDNIMLKTSGHLFHIDFGKFLGDAQMFGNFKRDRTPFVLTSDMAYVINGGDKPTEKFHYFVDLCCQAFNIIRQNGNLILNLFGMMVSSGIPGVTMDAVQYVQRALLLDKSNPEASSVFAKMIESSLKSWFTQFNFFLHNLAQLRFSGEHNEQIPLSFIPKVYTLEQDGRIRNVEVYSYQKRYDQEKYYIYILRVNRDNQPDPSYLFRTYKEFCEFHQKLCIMFPLAKLHSLPTNITFGRSNIKLVAEKRQADIRLFLESLFTMADEIAHSPIVYTFFHPLLRDQQEADINIAKVKESKTDRSSFNKNDISGQLKLSLHYEKGTLIVLVHHARGLTFASNGTEPSTYVKCYLMPDKDKSTKRKTKVVKKTCHPTFMENLEYRMSLEVIQRKTLRATVWNHDPLQENEFLGGIDISLHDKNLNIEHSEWYSLRNLTR